MNVLLLSKKIDIINKMLHKESIIGFIPTAGEVYENPSWIEEDKSLILEYGYKVRDIDITNNTKEQSIQIINDVDCLYIAGGNVFYLKQQIEEKQLKETILQFINNNKLYIGASAGSCLCAPSLEIYQTLDDPKKATKLEDYTGLDIIDFAVVPHYGREKYLNRHEAIIKQYNKKHSLIALKDNEALLFEERDKYKLYSM